MSNLYLAVKPPRLIDLKASLDLIAECYGRVHSALAPFGMGFIIETKTPIPKEHKDTLGVIDWV